MNLGGYDKYSFNESDGNSQLSLLLQKNKSIKTHFKEGEKGINDDGYFELLKNDGVKNIAIGKVMVQIKTIDKEYINHNSRDNIQFRYKYLCETKIFNAVSAGIFLDPAILILWDINNSKAFYINLTNSYAEKLNITNESKKVIFFNDEDQITDVHIFYKKMLEIYNQRKELLLKKPRIEIKTSPKVIASLQKSVDILNDFLSRKLKFILNELDKNIWKVGIAYLCREKNIQLAIYSINYGENELLVKQISPDDYHKYISNIIIANNIASVDYHVKQFTNDLIKKFYNKTITNMKYFSDIVLDEIIFLFLDEIATYCREYAKNGFPNVFYKDDVTIDEVQLMNDALLKTTINSLSVNRDAPYSRYITNPFKSHLLGRKSERNDNSFIDLVEKGNIKFELSNIEIVYKGDFDFKLFKNALEEAYNRNKIIFKRQWKHPNYLNFLDDLVGNSGYNRHETGYIMDDFYNNIAFLINSVPREYNDLIQKISPIDNEVLKNNFHHYFFYKIGNPDISYKSIIKKSHEFFATIENKDIGTYSDEALFITSSGFYDVISPNKPILYNQITQLLLKKISTYFEIKYTNLEGLIF